MDDRTGEVVTLEIPAGTLVAVPMKLLNRPYKHGVWGPDGHETVRAPGWVSGHPKWVSGHPVALELDLGCVFKYFDTFVVDGCLSWV